MIARSRRSAPADDRRESDVSLVGATSPVVCCVILELSEITADVADAAEVTVVDDVAGSASRVDDAAMVDCAVAVGVAIVVVVDDIAVDDSSGISPVLRPARIVRRKLWYLNNDWNARYYIQADTKSKVTYQCLAQEIVRYSVVSNPFKNSLSSNLNYLHES